jgi:RimJ/RimL family protein N-acetyltransferase
MADNERALKLYKKAGFVIEGIMKEDHYIQGEYKDVILLAYFRK